VPHASKPGKPTKGRVAWSVPDTWRGPSTGSNTGLDHLKRAGLVGHPLGKNPGDVWPLATAGYRGAHHAVFPERLVERPLLATCPEKVCSQCGRPWKREPIRTLGHLAVAGELLPTCQCNAESRPGIVLDPFMGSGTVASTATRLGRHWLGIELNPAFADLANERLSQLEQRPPPLRAA